MMECAQSLSEAELARCSPRPAQGGHHQRAYCPFHKSDHQRSLRVNMDTGRFECFSCGIWGYLDAFRRTQAPSVQYLRPRPIAPPPVAPRPSPPEALTRRGASGVPVLIERMWEYQTALRGSPGEAYLRMRGIPLELAWRHGVGYCPPGRWLNPGRDWKGGRLVFPHTTREGDVINLYGRAVGPDEGTPKAIRHDHLAGAKAWFNGRALASRETLYLCEGAFDALALLAAGLQSVIAIFGLGDWRWSLVREASTIVIALDVDGPGQKQAQTLAREGAALGKRVLWLESSDYGGQKDPSSAWQAGTLQIPQHSLEGHGRIKDASL